ncbi:MAG: hypothetical protein JOY71_03480, partial [Acetobacteraceae bacterium]|nr:hypothetical protein [Acetobacteraceae bacterium]
VTVRPGDVVAGDRDGVVVVPQERLEAVLVRLERVKLAELEMDTKVAKGLSIPTVVEKLAADGRIKYLD